jgi:hypothetical protein
MHHHSRITVFAALQVQVYVGQQLARSLREPLQRTISRYDAKLQQLDAGFGPQSVKARAVKNAALDLLSYDWTEQHQQHVLDRCVGGRSMRSSPWHEWWQHCSVLIPATTALKQGGWHGCR